MVYLELVLGNPSIISFTLCHKLSPLCREVENMQDGSVVEGRGEGRKEKARRRRGSRGGGGECEH